MATKKTAPKLPDEAAAFALAIAKANGHPDPEAYVGKVKAAFEGTEEVPAEEPGPDAEA